MLILAILVIMVPAAERILKLGTRCNRDVSTALLALDSDKGPRVRIVLKSGCS